MVTFFGLTATVSRAFPLAGRFCTGFAAVFFTATFLAIAFFTTAFFTDTFLAATFFAFVVTDAFALAGRPFEGLAAAFFTGAFLVATFFIAVFFVIFSFAETLEDFFAFWDLSASFLAVLADFTGFDLAEEALGFDTLDLALDADRPDFFSLVLVICRALFAIVLYLLLLYGVRIYASKPYIEGSLYHGPRPSFNQ